MLEFLKCVFTGIGGILLLVAIIGCLCGIGWLIGKGCEVSYAKLTANRPRLQSVGSGISTVTGVAVGVFICAVAATGIILGMHDLGCVMKKHPEHKIFFKVDKPAEPHKMS
jgi:hypothetical protein